MNQDGTCHGGWPWYRPHCGRWGPSSPSPKRAQPPFLANICCGQMAGWIKMPLSRKVALDLNDIVLDGDPAPLTKNGAETPIFGHVYCGQTAG